MFRRREDISPLSLLEQRLAYKTVQSGGDVPLHGLRKPAPERPKGESPFFHLFAVRFLSLSFLSFLSFSLIWSRCYPLDF